jgi:hypothetical protein
MGEGGRPDAQDSRPICTLQAEALPQGRSGLGLAQRFHASAVTRAEAIVHERILPSFSAAPGIGISRRRSDCAPRRQSCLGQFVRPPQATWPPTLPPRRGYRGAPSSAFKPLRLHRTQSRLMARPGGNTHLASDSAENRNRQSRTNYGLRSQVYATFLLGERKTQSETERDSRRVILTRALLALHGTTPSSLRAGTSNACAPTDIERTCQARK